MLDPLLSLVFSMQTNKGVYTLLLGSGVSRAAGIPTGWEIILNLIEKLRAVEGEKETLQPTELEEWFRKNYKEEPNYSILLEKLGSTPSERNKFLESYIEPTENDIEDGNKKPTKAHQAIAKLVKAGFIKVILTTNFDRLIEKALESEHITPIVISNVNTLKGSTPCRHNQCTIIKLHGDYKDTRIKNTQKELEKYDSELDQYLDTIFDEFGLVICGWSGEWDEALRKAITRCKSRRFSKYWTTLHPATGKAKELIQHCNAIELQIQNADTFFEELQEKITALEELNRPHPLSPLIAIETIKKYLVEAKYRIKLNDLVTKEAEKIYSTFADLSMYEPIEDFGLIQKRIKFYEAHLETLMSMLITGCYHGNKDHTIHWERAIKRMIDSQSKDEGDRDWLRLSYYPTLLLHYATGIACMANKNWNSLVPLIQIEYIHEDLRKKLPLFSLSSDYVIDKNDYNKFDGKKNKTPISDYLHKTLKIEFKNLIPNEKDFNNLFEKFEYCRALISYNYFNKEADLNFEYAPVGQYIYKNSSSHLFRDKHISNLIESDLKKLNSSKLKTALKSVNINIDELIGIKPVFDEYIKKHADFL